MILQKNCKYIVHVNDSKVTFCEDQGALKIYLASLNFDEIREATIFGQLSTAETIDLKNAAMKLQG